MYVLKNHLLRCVNHTFTPQYRLPRYFFFPLDTNARFTISSTKPTLLLSYSKNNYILLNYKIFAISFGRWNRDE